MCPSELSAFLTTVTRTGSCRGKRSGGFAEAPGKSMVGLGQSLPLLECAPSASGNPPVAQTNKRELKALKTVSMRGTDV